MIDYLQKIEFQQPASAEPLPLIAARHAPITYWGLLRVVSPLVGGHMSPLQAECRIELLLKRTQMRWLRHLTRMPPVQGFRVGPGYTGGIMSDLGMSWFFPDELEEVADCTRFVPATDAIPLWCCMWCKTQKQLLSIYPFIPTATSKQSTLNVLASCVDANSCSCSH